MERERERKRDVVQGGAGHSEEIKPGCGDMGLGTLSHRSIPNLPIFKEQIDGLMFLTGS